MITQYSTSYSSVSTDIQNIVANSVSLLDKYVLVQTGDNEYTALIKNIASKEIEQITISRQNATGYNNRYVVDREIVKDFSWNIPYEYYAYSNCGFGKSLDIPAYQGALTYGVTALTTLVFFAVIFKGALFKCLKSKR